jgi:hypothetical protein
VARLAAEVASAGRGSVAAIVFFGSRKTGASPAASSAWDFFVITRPGYREFYRALAAGGRLRRPAWLVAALNTWLPPNQISLRTGDGLAKCAVISLDDLARETSARRADHFLLGRLFQPVSVVHCEPETRAVLLDCLVSALRLTFVWGRPYLPESFGLEEYGRSLLAASFGREIRPEAAGRVEALWRVQAADLLPSLERLLEELADAGELARAGGGRYRLARPVTPAERRRTARYFRWSMVRATARWAKYVLTFDDWLDFIVKKAERHSGAHIELTSRERRAPLIFLWPRVFRFLRARGGAR